MTTTHSADYKRGYIDYLAGQRRAEYAKHWSGERPLDEPNDWFFGYEDAESDSKNGLPLRYTADEATDLVEPQVQYLAFQRIASAIDGSPIYSCADILEPLPRYRRSLLRSARLTAGSDGYVLVGTHGQHARDCRKISGLDPARQHRATGG